MCVHPVIIVRSPPLPCGAPCVCCVPFCVFVSLCCVGEFVLFFGGLVFSFLVSLALCLDVLLTLDGVCILWYMYVCML